METTWYVIIVSLCFSLLIKALFHHLLPSKSQKNVETTKPLPPGPTISSLLLLLKYSRPHGPLPLIKQLRSKFGPIFTLYVGSWPSIWISDPNLAHQCLIQNGANTADRLRTLPTQSIFNSNQHTVSTSAYGPTWQTLRHNMTSNFLNPAQLGSFHEARKWALDILIGQLEAQSVLGSPVQVRDHILRAMFRLQSAMCFGLLLDEDQLREVQSITRRILLGLPRFKFNILNSWPNSLPKLIRKILLDHRWAKLQDLRKELDEVYLGLIKARKGMNQTNERKMVQYCYVDSLLELNVPNEEGGNRKLTQGEMVSLCYEFIYASTDLITTELEWVMANLVKHPKVQSKLVDDMKRVVGPDPHDPDNIKEEDLNQILYLKAVILEVLRRHPPTHFVMAHRVAEDMELGGYLVPKNAAVNVLVAEIGRDPNTWEDPMGFKPERFLKSQEDGNMSVEFDVGGRKEIKMIPFGVGRRMCPGNVLARLNLEYFVANLVWRFEWKPINGKDVDLSETEVFSIVMKNPLKAQISPRTG